MSAMPPNSHKRRQPPRPRHVPVRTCIACRQSRPKRELIRVVRTPDGHVLMDPTGKKSGRGAYLCARRSCWEPALRQGRLEREFEVTLTEEDRVALEGYIETLPVESAKATGARVGSARGAKGVNAAPRPDAAATPAHRSPDTIPAKPQRRHLCAHQWPSRNLFGISPSMQKLLRPRLDARASPYRQWHHMRGLASLRALPHVSVAVASRHQFPRRRLASATMADERARCRAGRAPESGVPGIARRWRSVPSTALRWRQVLRGLTPLRASRSRAGLRRPALVSGGLRRLARRGPARPSR